MDNLAPVVLFVYNRAGHTQKTLEALAKNDLADKTTLYIYADGPKAGCSEDDLQKIKDTRDIIRSHKWCAEIVIFEAESNKGLANSIIAGVTDTVNKHGKVIVLEDDIVTSAGFLTYMNDALSVYQDEEKVMHISGYIYPYKNTPPLINDQTTFFANVLSCWGWATWARAWKYYEHDVDKHLEFVNTNYGKKKFDIEGHAGFYNQLVLNKQGAIYSWAVRWYASWLEQKGYSLFPYKSLVINNGFDNTGVHCAETDQFFSEPADHIKVVKQEIKENIAYRKAIDRFYYGITPYFKNFIKNILKAVGLYKLLKKNTTKTHA